MELNDYEVRHIELLRKAAPECMVLLKKDGSLPFSDEVKTVALYGNGAAYTEKGGTGSGEVNSRFFISIEEGVENAGREVVTGSWLNSYDEIRKAARKEFAAEIVKKAMALHMRPVDYGFGIVMPEPDYDLPTDEEADACIYVLSRTSGEGSDRQVVPGDFLPTSTEIRDIKALSQRFGKFVLLLNTGGPVDLTELSFVGNILLVSQLGTVTGDAVADVVFGKAYPSGKLSATWCAYEDYPAIGDFGGESDTRYKEGIYVGYRYFESIGKEAAYPFGYGLSYADFGLGSPEITLDGRMLSIRLSVMNTGKYPGKEVLEAYVTAPWGVLDQPKKKLVAFSKTKEIGPGEADDAVITIDLLSFESYEPGSSSNLIEKGDYIIRLGNSSVSNIPVCVVSVKEDIILQKVHHIGGKPDFSDWKPEHFWKDEDTEKLPVFDLDAEAFSDIVPPALSRPSAEAMKFVSGLSDAQVAQLTVGYHRGKQAAVFSAIGLASHTVPGACGDIAKDIQGVPTVCMADGPAGLRLAPRYLEVHGEVRLFYDERPDEFTYNAFSSRKPLFMQGGQEPDYKYQYCTAIPIGTAIAQSWSPEIARLCGDIVGDEMERFGVDIWLAPGMNIQRNPLCGRNFEYYSEDPFLTGSIASAITRGVQSHLGRKVCLKHFCANSQETNRYHSNSIMSERTLREIYLYAFRYTIENAFPGSIMTSYNLLNGIHTSERSDLLKTYLRYELGYDGLVMSDWTGPATRRGTYRNSEAARSVKAGNDIFMPGSSYDEKHILSAIKGKNPDAKLTREEALVCAARVVETAWKIEAERKK